MSAEGCSLVLEHDRCSIHGSCWGSAMKWPVGEEAIGSRLGPADNQLCPLGRVSLSGPHSFTVKQRPGWDQGILRKPLWSPQLTLKSDVSETNEALHQAVPLYDPRCLPRISISERCLFLGSSAVLLCLPTCQVNLLPQCEVQAPAGPISAEKLPVTSLNIDIFCI